MAGAVAVLGFLFGPFTGEASLFVGAGSSVLFGVNSGLNMAINAANLGGAAISYETQLDDWAKSTDAYTKLMNGSQQALIDASNAVFQKGTNVTSISKGGGWVDDNMIKSATDGSVSGLISNAAT